MLQKAGGRVFDQIQHPVKTLRTAVIWIGHLPLREAPAEFQEKLGIRWCAIRFQRTEKNEVFAIHGENVVEFHEIGRQYAAAADTRKIVAALCRGGRRTRVRGIARVVAMRARRINQDAAFQPFRLHEMAKNSFCRGRTADISHADENNFNHFLIH